MSFLLQTITIEGYSYPVIVTMRKQAKSLTLRLKQPQQELHITAPAGARKKEVHAFFEASMPRITKHMRAHTPLQPLLLEDGCMVPIFGKAHRLSLTKEQAIKDDMPLFLIPYHHGEVGSAILKALQRTLLARAHQQMMDIFAMPAFTPLPSPIFTVRDTRSRWGSCNPHHSRIMLSWRLIFAPLHVANSVIIHELCHLIHANHSVAFWELVALHDPFYQQSNAWLKQHGKSLFQYKVCC